MPKKRKAKHRKASKSHPCGCHYCMGTTTEEWLKMKYNYLKDEDHKQI